MRGNATGSPGEGLDATFFRTGVWECVVAVVGAPVNLLVVCLALSLVTRSSGRRRGRKSYSQYYVLSMTAADFVFTSIHAPLYGIMYVCDLDYSFPVCRFLYIVTHTSTVASSLSLLCLNVDKFVAVHRPLHHALIMNKRTAVGLLAACWAVSSSWAVLLTCGPLTSMPEPCRVSLNHEVVYYTFAVLFFVLPILSSFAIAVYVAVVTGKTSASRNESAGARGEDSGAQQHATKEFLYQRHWTRERARTSLDKYKWQAKTLTFVFCTTVWSTVTSIPYRASVVLQIYDISSMELSMFLFGLMAANALGNPVITLFTQRQYRTRLGKFFGRVTNNECRFPLHSTYDSVSSHRSHALSVSDVSPHQIRGYRSDVGDADEQDTLGETQQRLRETVTRLVPAPRSGSASSRTRTRRSASSRNGSPL